MNVSGLRVCSVEITLGFLGTHGIILLVCVDNS